MRPTMRLWAGVVLVTLVGATDAGAQVTPADYDRAMGLRDRWIYLTENIADPPTWVDGDLSLLRASASTASAGGQNSVGGLLFHPDFYKVAVSYAGCHDNRMDKIGWNEQWMAGRSTSTTAQQ